MLSNVKGFLTFISLERGIMVFMITMGATFLITGSAILPEAIFLGFIAFCIWSGADAINNVYDVDLDVKSDPFRSDYTRNLGNLGRYIFLFFSILSISLGLMTGIVLVAFFIVLGVLAGIIYSMPPLRLRQTIIKPVVNFSVGAVPVLLVAAFFNVFSIQIMVLMLLVGISTAVNSLWEDLADFKSDFSAKARTILIVLGIKRGVYLTIFLGYCLIPLMVLVGILFRMNLLYFVILAALISYLSVRIVKNRKILFGKSSTNAMLNLGAMFAADFVIVALVFTINMMLSGYLTFQ